MIDKRIRKGDIVLFYDRFIRHKGIPNNAIINRIGEVLRSGVGKNKGSAMILTTLGIVQEIEKKELFKIPIRGRACISLAAISLKVDAYQGDISEDSWKT